MVSNLNQPNIFEITGLVARKENAAKLALPVSQSLLLYSRYKHVRGAPAIGSSEGFPLSKLRALDNLIDRLIRVHGNQPIVKHIEELRDDEIDGLLASYRKGLHRIATDPSKVITTGSASNDLGLTLNLVA